MRSIILLYLLLSGTFAIAQDNYILSGKIENAGNVSKAYLFYPKQPNEYAFESCYIKDNHFSFSGSVEYPVFASLVLRDKDIPLDNNPGNTVHFYLENSTITLKINTNNSSVMVSGSNTHNLHVEFMKILEPIKEEMHSIQEAYRNATPGQRDSRAFNDSLQKREMNVRAMNSESIQQFVKGHPDDFFSLYLLQTQSDNAPDDECMMNLFSGLSGMIRNTTLGKRLADKLQRQQATSIGALAPDFECKDINGNPVKLSGFRGKYLLLMFWSSDCGHCLDELPDIEKVFKEFSGDNFTILAIAQDVLEREKDWTDFVRNRELTWTNIFDERVDGKKKVAGLYNVQRIPFNLLLDNDGMIIAKDLHGEDLFNQLTSLKKDYSKQE